MFICLHERVCIQTLLYFSTVIAMTLHRFSIEMIPGWKLKSSLHSKFECDLGRSLPFTIQIARNRLILFLSHYWRRPNRCWLLSLGPESPSWNDHCWIDDFHSTSFRLHVFAFILLPPPVSNWPTRPIVTFWDFWQAAEVCGPDHIFDKKRYEAMHVS
jgi:hypothetical protein